MTLFDRIILILILAALLACFVVGRQDFSYQKVPVEPRGPEVDCKDINGNTYAIDTGCSNLKAWVPGVKNK